MIVAVPYYRTSTDDKDQDPMRQAEIVEPWAAREGVTLLAPEIDEGTSASKINPLDRPAFIRACERAKAAGADGIVVECSDRFSRQGTKWDSWAEIEVERRYGLKLYRADKSLDAHGSMVGNVTDSIHAESGRAWVQEHSKKVRSGMVNAKAGGARFGRPRKDLTPAEMALVSTLRGQGDGWRAHAVSEKRGAFDVVDPKRSKALRVSHSHVRRSLGGS